MNPTVSVLLFGITRDLTGQSSVSVPLGAGARVSELLEQLYQSYPPLAAIRSVMVAVNGEYAEVDQVIQQSDEIALIPPVSGG
ncbi:molybdopterin converting factor subunit 1 [Spirosoma daeguense]